VHVRLGIIGPQDSINFLRDVCQDFPGDFSIIERPYDNYEDLKELETTAKNVDVLLFSGQAPYFWTKSHLKLDIPSVYIPRNGTCLYKVLFDIYRDGIDVSHISFDTLSPRDIEETYRELNLPLAEILAMDYDEYLPFNELIEYHHKHWKKGKIRAAVTCLAKPFEELKKLGVPSYRIYPTRSIVRQALEKAILYGESMRLKETQMALILVRVEGVDKIFYDSSSYQLHIQLLDLYQILLEYGDETNATVVKTGDTEFMVITTRGCLEESTSLLIGSPLITAIKNNSTLDVNIGIGYGLTAKMAEANARRALQLSSGSGGNCCFVVTEKGNILGPIREEKRKAQHNWDTDLKELAQKLNMNVFNLNKLRSSLRRLNKSDVTPKELSASMNISQRSARRILSQLEQRGAAKVIGIKNMSGKGRPPLVYKVYI